MKTNFPAMGVAMPRAARPNAARPNAARAPKYLQVVNAIVADIEKGKLTLGDRLPSLNEACADWYLSKDSIKRAYATLHQQGFITSVNRRGFFIAAQPNRRALRVLIVAGQLTERVKQLHDAIAASVGREVILDVCSYKHQQQLLCRLLEKHLGDYHYYLIMPHLAEVGSDMLQCLRNVPSSQMILIGDQWGEVLQHGHQVRFGSEQDLYSALVGKSETFRKYRLLNLVLPEQDIFDAESIRAFQRFCVDKGFEFQLLDDLCENDIRPNEAYFVADSHHLIALVDHCQRADWPLGEKLGVVSFIENEYTQLLAGGVSVISHPSQKVGRLVATILKGESNPVPYSLPLETHFRASC